MITDINSEDRLVRTTFAEHLEKELGLAVHLPSLPSLANPLFCRPFQLQIITLIPAAAQKGQPIP